MEREISTHCLQKIRAFKHEILLREAERAERAERDLCAAFRSAPAINSVVKDLTEARRTGAMIRGAYWPVKAVLSRIAQ